MADHFKMTVGEVIKFEEKVSIFAIKMREYLYEDQNHYDSENHSSYFEQRPCHRSKKIKENTIVSISQTTITLK